MRCPFCGETSNRVIDTRVAHGEAVTRRRRECENCGRRFTTYERVEQTVPMVVKKDGRREAFDRGKAFRGIQHACVKRPVSVATLEKLVDELEQVLIDTGEKEVLSPVIGEHLMSALRRSDRVAYVRFASVYRDFRDLEEFDQELSTLRKLNATEPAGAMDGDATATRNRDPAGKSNAANDNAASDAAACDSAACDGADGRAPVDGAVSEDHVAGESKPNETSAE